MLQDEHSKSKIIILRLCLPSYKPKLQLYVASPARKTCNPLLQPPRLVCNFCHFKGAHHHDRRDRVACPPSCICTHTPPHFFLPPLTRPGFTRQLGPGLQQLAQASPVPSSHSKRWLLIIRAKKKPGGVWLQTSRHFSPCVLLSCALPAVHVGPNLD